MYIHTYIQILSFFSVNKVAGYKLPVLNYTKSLSSAKTLYILVAKKSKTSNRHLEELCLFVFCLFLLWFLVQEH